MNSNYSHIICSGSLETKPVLCKIHRYYSVVGDPNFFRSWEIETNSFKLKQSQSGSFMFFHLQCVAPQFVGNGHQCTLDTDRDGYPDQALQSPDCIVQSDMPYCHQDTCPTLFNIPQEDDSPCRENQTGGIPEILFVASNIERP